jgi:hypothetical protein
MIAKYQEGDIVILPSNRTLKITDVQIYDDDIIYCVDDLMRGEMGIGEKELEGGKVIPARK